MKIELVAKDDSHCALNNCPAKYRVVGVPGGTVYIGKRLEELDSESYEQVKDSIGPGEGAFWVPDGL
jgi:hypothetical protein